MPPLSIYQCGFGQVILAVLSQSLPSSAIHRFPESSDWFARSRRECHEIRLLLAPKCDYRKRLMDSKSTKEVNNTLNHKAFGLFVLGGSQARADHGSLWSNALPGAEQSYHGWHVAINYSLLVEHHTTCHFLAWIEQFYILLIYFLL